MRTHGFCLTINNPQESDWLPYLREDQTEEPFGWSSPIPHKEGVVSKHEFKQMHKKIFPRAHIEHARGTFNEARTYCTKQDKYYEYGYETNICRDNILK